MLIDPHLPTSLNQSIFDEAIEYDADDDIDYVLLTSSNGSNDSLDIFGRVYNKGITFFNRILHYLSYLVKSSRQTQSIFFKTLQMTATGSDGFIHLVSSSHSYPFLSPRLVSMNWKLIIHPRL